MGIEIVPAVFPYDGESDVVVVPPVVVPPTEETHLVSTDIVDNAITYTKKIGLALQAAPSVANAIITSMALKRQIQYELSLPDEEKRLIIGAPKDMVITKWHIRRAERFSQANEFPLSTVYFTKELGVAAKAAGWRARLHADPRIFKGFVVVSKDASETKTDQGPVRIFKVTGYAEFWNGEQYPETGVISSDEPRAGRTSLSFFEMIAMTRFQTRAIRSALGLPFDVAEDVMAGEAVEIAAAPTTKALSQKIGISDFMSQCKELGLTKVQEILTRLGITNLGEITDYAEAITRLKAPKNGQEGAPGSAPVVG